MTDTTEPVAAPPTAAKTVSARICWLALGAILILATVLRLHGISAASLWFDESISWHQASQPVLAMIALMTADVHPPLYNTILHFFILAFGDDTEALVRLPSAIMGVAGVAAIFWVASLIDGRTTGFLAALLLCLSGYHIHYSQEARPYALLALTATLFAGTLIRALETNRSSWHAASSGAALFLLYSHAYGGLLWLCLGFAAIAGAKIRRNPEPKILARWAAWQAIAVLLFLPWAGILAWRYKVIVTNGFWIQKPDTPFMLDFVRNLASGDLMALGLIAGATVALIPLALIPRPLNLLARGRDVGVEIGAASRRPQAEHHEILCRWLLIAWLLGPPLLALIASLISQPVLIDRYVICSLPAWLILASMGVCRLSRIWGKWVLALAIAGMIANQYFYEPQRHENARAMVAAYIERAAPGDCLFVASRDLSLEVGFYLRNPPPCFAASHLAVNFKPWALAAPRAWLYLGFIKPDNQRALFDNLQAHAWQAQSIMSSWGVSLFLAEPAK